MRVVHVSSSDRQGGASLAMWRLHEGLCQLGVDSRVVVRKRTVPDERVSTVAFRLAEEADRFNLERLNKKLCEGATWVSSVPVRANLLEHPWVEAAEIVHLHWIASFLDAEVVRRLEQAGKLVFWTFHDLRPFTGFCHFTGGCRGFETTCSRCPQADEGLHEMIEKNRLSLHHSYASERLQIIVASEWARRMALASGLFEASRVHVVCYGLEEAFCVEPEEGSNGMTIKGDKVQLLFGCQALRERRKGFAELRAALDLAMQEAPFAAAVAAGRLELVTFGLEQPGLYDGIRVPVRSLGTVNGVDSVAKMFQEASVLICPTLEDTGPLVVLESLACGRPVIGFKMGVLEDVVVDGVNGLLALPGDVVGLAHALTRVLLEDGLLEKLTNGAMESANRIPKLKDAARLVQQLYWDQLAGLAEHVEPVHVETLAVEPASQQVLREFLKLSPTVVEQHAQIQHLEQRLEAEIAKKEALKVKLEELKRKQQEKKEREKESVSAPFWSRWMKR